MLNERKRLWYALSLQTGLCRWVVYQIIFPPTPALGQWVKKYIQSCTTCTHSKAMRHRPYRLLKQLPVPPHPWESISMDFIETSTIRLSWYTSSTCPPTISDHLRLCPPTLQCHSDAHCVSSHNHATPVAGLNSDQCLISLDLVPISRAATYLSFSPYATIA